MGDDDSEERKREIEREARRGRTFTIADVLGKEGASLFQGESPTSRLEQVTLELCQYLGQELNDVTGGLRRVLERHVRMSETILSEHFDQPFAALQIIVQELLSNDERLFEFVRQVDAEWGRLMLERPHFQRPGDPPDPEDEYTHESVRADLLALLDKIRERNKE